MTEIERTLPRGGSGRLALGIASLFLGTLFGFGTLIVLLTPLPRFGLLFTLLLFVTVELLMATTMLAVIGFTWAVAMPAWVEGLFRSAWKRLFLAIWLALLPIAILIILACFGIKIGGGLVP